MIKIPHEIEKKSFEIIAKELNRDLEDSIASVIYRVIHTTADFEYGDITQIHKDAIQRGRDAIKGGCKIYVDTNMILSGINKTSLKKYNSSAYSLIADEDVAREAKERNITRSIVGMEKAVEDKDTKIFVIGNAPTALFTLKEKIESGLVKPQLIVGVPVGFVGAAESKEAIKECEIPYIVTNGRKGGSTVAVAIINAILYEIE